MGLECHQVVLAPDPPLLLGVSSGGRGEYEDVLGGWVLLVESMWPSQRLPDKTCIGGREEFRYACSSS